MKICPFCFHKAEQIGHNEYQCTWCPTFLAKEDLTEIKAVRFFCPECGKEMWAGTSAEDLWAQISGCPIASLKWLLECSDCLLLEIQREELGHEVTQEILNKDGYVDNQLLGC